MAGRTLALRYGPPWAPVTGTEMPGSWPNWHLTSSGVAHHIIPTVSFLAPARQLKSGAFCPVHGRRAPTPGRTERSAHLGFRRGHQQMGDDLRLGLRAQEPRRALRAAAGHRVCGSQADSGNQGFRRKAQTPQLAPPCEHEVPEKRDEGAVHLLARPGPGPHRLRRAPAPGAGGPPPWGSFPGSNSLDEERRAGRSAVHNIRSGCPGPPPALSDHIGPGFLPEEPAVRISMQGLVDFFELQGDAPRLGSRLAGPAVSVADPRAPRAPREAARAAPRGPLSGSGVLQPPAASTARTRPLLPAGSTLGRPPLEAAAGHLQRAKSLQHRKLLLRQLQARAGLSPPGKPRPGRAPCGRSQAWRTATGRS
nr:uncharacterized protein LOC105865600 isoform X1 [Microcebus murinus]XP_012609728.1 uncharacterized protein LOC105865600 isoform X1 [Microcebus murinus]